MAIATDSFFGSGATPTSATANTTTTSETLPDWLQEYTRGVMAQGTGVYEQPYQQYTGPRLTSIGDYGQAQQGMDMSAANVGAWQPAFGQAQTTMGQANQTMPQGIEAYMNPYQGAVVDRIGQLGTRNFQEELAPQINSTFAGAGQFGSSRNADFMNRALRDVGENTLAQQNQALQTGYQNAATNFGSDMTRLANLGSQYQNLGQNTSTMGQQDATSMYNLGNLQKAEDQQSYDLAYNQFLEQRDYPKSQLEYMNSLVRGLPVTKSSFATSSPVPAYTGAGVSPSPLAAVGTGLSNSASTAGALSRYGV